MMSRPEKLAQFIDRLPSTLEGDETLELVLNGDIIDFLALPARTSTGELSLDGDGHTESDAWTPTADQAVHKIRDVIHGEDRVVFESLAVYLGRGHRLTVALGNHDTELALPTVQHALRSAMEDGEDRVFFVDDGRPVRIGPILIEHGNRYDGANYNDWDTLRALSSAQARAEPTGSKVPQASAGSRLVEKFVNPLKRRGYPFLDLFQPQDETLAFLMLALEPSLKYDWLSIARLFRAARKQQHGIDGAAPRRRRNLSSPVPDVSASPLLSSELEAFGELYETMLHPERSRNISAGKSRDGERFAWRRVFLESSHEGLRRQLKTSKPVPEQRLRDIQAVFRARAERDAHGTKPDSLELAAERMLEAGESCGRPITTVVMGHTHLPRCRGEPDRATYLNTGTWIDVIRMPATALLPDEEGLEELVCFLRRLIDGDESLRQFEPTWADLRVQPDGSLAHARLCSAVSGDPSIVLTE